VPTGVDLSLTLVLMAGLPGTGKSTVATAIGRSFGWPVLDKDIVNTVLLDAGMAQSTAGPLAYELMFALAADLVVVQRRSIIVDTAGRQPMILEQARIIADAASARLKVVRCVAPAATRAARLAGRTPRPSQWATDQATDADQDTWYSHLPPDTLVVATNQPGSTAIEAVVSFLSA
jgi:predicted kinase